MSNDLIYGIHVIQNILKIDPARILELSILEDRTDKRILFMEKAAKELGISIKKLSKKQFDIILPNIVHQGVMAKVRKKPLLSENDLIDRIEKAKKPLLFLVLDGVQDPHNLGACLRTCDAVGVDAVIIPKDRSVGVTAVVQKIASGAAETVPLIEVNNLVRCLEKLKKLGIWLMGTSDTASKSLFEVDLKGNIAIVMGAEGLGLRRLTEECCDFLLKIPMYGVVESLNVSVATAVCLYEAIRQRKTCITS